MATKPKQPGEKGKVECEGNCNETHEGHSGTVKEVVVSGQGWKPSTFNYCDNAIAEDKRRGFSVTITQKLNQ